MNFWDPRRAKFLEKILKHRICQYGEKYAALNNNICLFSGPSPSAIFGKIQSTEFCTNWCNASPLIFPKKRSVTVSHFAFVFQWFIKVRNCNYKFQSSRSFHFASIAEISFQVGSSPFDYHLVRIVKVAVQHVKMWHIKYVTYCMLQTFLHFFVSFGMSARIRTSRASA